MMSKADVKTWYTRWKYFPAEVETCSLLTVLLSVRRVLVNNSRLCRFLLLSLLLGCSVILTLSLLTADKDSQYIPNSSFQRTSVKEGPLFHEDTDTKDKEDYIQGRLKRVDTVCQSKTAREQLTEFYPQVMNHIFVNDEYKFLYCEVPKVACTTFKAIMILLTGELNATRPRELPASMVHGEYQRQYLRKLSNYTSEEILHRIENYYKFMFVREPLERMLSAYRNKFTVKYNDYFNSRFGRFIIKKFRDNPSEASLAKGNDMTFREFVQYLIDPVFPQKLPFNAHWLQYYKLCLPCQIKYDFIGKYEHLKEDADEVLHRLGVDKKIHFPKAKPHIKTTGGVVKRFYKNITSQQVHKLWKLYSVDYSMFGYNYPNVH